MRISDDIMSDENIYIVISNGGKVLKCFGNKENAYGFATRECFKYCSFTMNENNKEIIEEIYNVDADEYADFTTKLELIHKNYIHLIKTEMDYYNLVRVEEHELNTEDIYE